MSDIKLEIPKKIHPEQYEVGVIISRLQTPYLHDAHKHLIDTVCKNHSKVVIFLGVSNVRQSEKNPLDFSTRKIMVQELYPHVTILPLKDERSNEAWSKKIDRELTTAFDSSGTFLLYGGRDSFIPYYSGKHQTVELVSSHIDLSGTAVRREAARQPLMTEEARRGAVYQAFGRYPITYPTVDVVATNTQGQILMAKKPGEKLWRFIGGFVDPTDNNWEQSARREFAEETGGCEIADLKYVTSGRIDDWRYKGERDGIMTTLYIGTFVYGKAEPTDDIDTLGWLNPEDIQTKDVMDEHRELFTKLKDYLKK